jgi:ankyrin repeat protein
MDGGPAAAGAAPPPPPPPTSFVDVATLAATVGFAAEILPLSRASRSAWADCDLLAALVRHQRRASVAERPAVDAVRLDVVHASRFLPGESTHGHIQGLVLYHLHLRGEPVDDPAANDGLRIPGWRHVAARLLPASQLTVTTSFEVDEASSAACMLESRSPWYEFRSRRSPAWISAVVRPAGGGPPAWRIAQWGISFRGATATHAPTSVVLRGRLRGTDVWVKLDSMVPRISADQIKAKSLWWWSTLSRTADGGARVSRRRLAFACAHGMVDRINCILSAGEDPNIIGPYGISVFSRLFEARGGVAGAAVVRALVAAGHDLDARDFNGDTPLIMAVQRRLIILSKVLIKAGADVNVEGADGWTPLLHAANAGCAELCADLVAAGADVDVHLNVDRGSGIRQPLMFFVWRNLVDVSLFLLAAGAGVNEHDGWDTPLTAALSSKPLSSSRIALSRALVAAGAYTNTFGDDGDLPLVVALRAGSVTLLRALIAAGAKVDPTELSVCGMTPLTAAARISSVTMVVELLAVGADSNFCDAMQLAPLVYAIEARSLAVACVLLAAGADPHATDEDGYTAWKGYGKPAEFINFGTAMCADLDDRKRPKRRRMW